MKNTQDKFAVLSFICLFSTKWQSTSANFPNEGTIVASIDKLTEIVERNQCKTSKQNLGERLIENVENSIFLHRKTSEQLNDLEAGTCTYYFEAKNIPCIPSEYIYST